MAIITPFLSLCVMYDVYDFKIIKKNRATLLDSLFPFFLFSFLYRITAPSPQPSIHPPGFSLIFSVFAQLWRLNLLDAPPSVRLGGSPLPASHPKAMLQQILYLRPPGLPPLVFPGHAVTLPWKITLIRRQFKTAITVTNSRYAQIEDHPSLQ